MKIVIVNQPTNNRGDESAHKALVRRIISDIAEAEVEVIFIGRTEEQMRSIRVTSGRVRYTNIRNWYHWYGLTEMQKRGRYGVTFIHPTTLSLLWHMMRADIVVCAPGGINMGGFQSWYHVYTMRLAATLGKKIIYWGRSIGPFPEETADNRTFKALCMHLFERFGLITLRDGKSMELANRLGIKASATLDSAYLYPHQGGVPAEIATRLGREYIIFVPNSLTWHYAYRGVAQERIDGMWIEVMRKIRATHPGQKIAMLPQTFGGSDGRDGEPYFRRLAEKSGLEEIYVMPEGYDSDVQQAVIEGAGLVIGARYHSIVFAVNTGVPFVSLSYEHKMSGMLDAIGASAYMVDIQKAFENEETCNMATEHIGEKIEHEMGKRESERLSEVAKAKTAESFEKFKKYVEA